MVNLIAEGVTALDVTDAQRRELGRLLAETVSDADRVRIELDAGIIDRSRKQSEAPASRRTN